MRVFLSFSQGEAVLAAKLADALRHRHIDVWSFLELTPGEPWAQRIDQECARADALVVLVGPGTANSPDLEFEWRTFLRNDWASSKPLIPLLTDPGAKMPSFLRGRQTVAGTSIDQAVDGIEHLLKHPGESITPAAHAKAKAEQEVRLEELEAFALALKEAATGHSGDVEHQ